MAVSSIRVRMSLRKSAKRLLFPLWVIQALFGKKPWIPRWAVKCAVEAGS